MDKKVKKAIDNEVENEKCEVLSHYGLFEMDGLGVPDREGKRDKIHYKVFEDGYYHKCKFFEVSEEEYAELLKRYRTYKKYHVQQDKYKIENGWLTLIGVTCIINLICMAIILIVTCM